MKDQELLDKVKDLNKSGTVDLGIANGWGPNESILSRTYDFLYKNIIPNTFSRRKIGLCYYEISFKSNFLGDTVNVYYKVDSGG